MVRYTFACVYTIMVIPCDIFFIFSKQMVRFDWILVAVTPKEFIVKSVQRKPPNLNESLTEFQIKNDRKIISRKRIPS